MTTESRLEALAAADLKMPGGCDDCDAYQTVTRGDLRIYRLTVHHDDGCPTFLRVKRERSAHAKWLAWAP